jgi:hypothetical protein
MSKKRKELLAASNVLQGVLQNSKSPLTDQFLRWKIWRFWPRIVGEGLAALSEPISFDQEKRMLVLWVKSSARMQDIRFFEGVIRDKVNEHVGRKWVRAIRFTLDRRGLPAPHEVPQAVKDFLDAPGPAPSSHRAGVNDDGVFSEREDQCDRLQRRGSYDPDRDPEL